MLVPFGFDERIISEILVAIINSFEHFTTKFSILFGQKTRGCARPFSTLEILCRLTWVFVRIVPSIFIRVNREVRRCINQVLQLEELVVIDFVFRKELHVGPLESI